MRAIYTTAATIPASFAPAPFDGIDDSREHHFGFAQHIMVPEAEDPKPLRFEKRRPLLVVLRPLGVLPAVEFDDEAHLHAAEVSDERANRHLSSKFRSSDLLGAQTRPEASLGVGLVAAELARAGWRSGVHWIAFTLVLSHPGEETLLGSLQSPR